MADEPGHLDQLIGTLFPGASIERLQLLSADAGGDDTHKVEGYGLPLRLAIRTGDGGRRVLVFHTATSNCFGHDRRSDRAAGTLLAFDTFGALPDHVRALDVGTILPDGRLLSLRESGEFYLLTGFAEGRMYAEDLRRIADAGVALESDVARCEELARWLARLHAERLDEPASYTRAVRDLLGHGEGIFGMVDGYGPDVPGAPPARLRALEERCLGFRWRLRGREARLCRTHGDFHPFNLVIQEEGKGFTLLDASRGGKGDPADDVVSMAVNFVFFAIDRRASWAGGLGRLWRRFWTVYLAESGDRGLLEVAAPWLAWRCLVVSSPRFYPNLPAAARDALLGLAERALDAHRFEPSWAEDLFR